MCVCTSSLIRARHAREGECIYNRERRKEIIERAQNYDGDFAFNEQTCIYIQVRRLSLARERERERDDLLF